MRKHLNLLLSIVTIAYLVYFMILLKQQKNDKMYIFFVFQIKSQLMGRSATPGGKAETSTKV